jgi:hypothetical protein
LACDFVFQWFGDWIVLLKMLNWQLYVVRVHGVVADEAGLAFARQSLPDFHCVKGFFGRALDRLRLQFSIGE